MSDTTINISGSYNTTNLVLESPGSSINVTTSRSN